MIRQTARRRAAHPARRRTPAMTPVYRRYLLKNSMVRCQASFAAASS